MNEEQQLDLIDQIQKENEMELLFITVLRLFDNREFYIKEALNRHLNMYMVSNKHSLTKEMVVNEAYRWIDNINWFDDDIDDNKIRSNLRYLVDDYSNSNRQLPLSIIYHYPGSDMNRFSLL